MCTIKEILRDKHMQLRVTAFLLLLVFPSESNYGQVYKSPLLASRLLSYPGTGRYIDDRKFCLQDCLGVAFFSSYSSRSQVWQTQIHSKGSLLTPAQRRKCLTKLFEVFLYSSPGILLNYRLDKAPRLFFVLHFCRNPGKQNAIMEEGSSRRHSDSRNLLSEAGIQLMSKIWNTNWSCRHPPAGQHFSLKKIQETDRHLKLKCQNLNVQIMGNF